MFCTKECIGRISSEDKMIFNHVWGILNFLQDVQDELNGDDKKLVWPNCHSMCRALRIHFGDVIEVVDGTITGVKQIQVIDRQGEIIHSMAGDGINHSWLRLPDAALIDPFPAGVFSLSPLFFPPFGHYEDIFPRRVYVEAELSCPWAKTPEVWKKAENIAKVLACHPYNPTDGITPSNYDRALIEQAKLRALDIVESLKQS